MKKIFIRTLWGYQHYWWDDSGRFKLRDLLNNLGFYVIHGTGDSLEVYALKEKLWWEKWL